MLGVLLGLLGCGSEPLPPAIGEHGAIPLARTRQTTSIALPKTNREKPLPPRVEPLGKLVENRRAKTWVEYKVPMPFRSIYLGHSASRLPRGLTLRTEYGKPFTYGNRDQAYTWRTDGRQLIFKLPPEVEATKKGMTLRYEPAYGVEKHRNQQWSDRNESDFVFRTVDIGNATVRGVYVPAPGTVSWKVTVPAHAHLRSRVHLLTPEVRIRTRSDGAVAKAVIADDATGEVLTEASCTLAVGKFCDLDVDLVGFDSRTVRVTLQSEPGKTTTLDYVFFEDPVVASVLDKPKQVVLVFIDTLRPDRLSTYGYARKTPAIDAFGAEGVVFDSARSVSPWTLPAARAVLTGRQPEEWDDAATLAGTLADRGWVTTAYVTNAFLSRPFGMGRDWGTYRYIFLNPAAKQVQSSQTLLEQHPGRNQLLLVHFMDTHLPYKEPEPYRTMYAGESPEGLPKRFGLLDMHKFENRPEARTYLSNRYDQTIKYVDDQLADLFATLDDDAIVLLYSDHGEEFWEHEGVEHGHAVWEEVMRVPLILKAPGVKPGRVSEPVTVMDIAPTIYDLLEIEPPPDLDGSSLVKLAAGEAEAKSAFQERAAVFGRTLRNRDAWGLVQGDTKIVATEGEVRAYDLAKDPGEKAPRELTPAELSEARSNMTDDLGRAVMPALRLRGPSPDKMWRVKDTNVRIELDGPVRAAWLGTNAPKKLPVVKENTVFIEGPGYLPNEIYILPEAPLGEVKQLTITVSTKGKDYTAVWPDEAQKDAWLRVGPPGQQAELGIELTPLPAAVEVPTSNAEMEDELKILGYIED